MHGSLQILILMAFILGGALLARLRLAPAPRLVDGLIKAALWALLLAMGFRMGNDRSLAASLGSIGLLAGAAALAAVGGTLLALLLGLGLLSRLEGRSRRGPGSGGESGGGAGAAPRGGGLGLGHLRAPLLLLGIVAGGFLLGLLLPPSRLELGALSAWSLNGLLFFIGMQFVQAGISLKGAFLRPETLAVPLLTALGSLAGGLLLVPLFGLGAGKALALVGGFGWYSLSGVLIADLGDPALGSASFMANMIRESLALLAIPFLARSPLPALAVGIGGATAMDVTLPLIEQSAGPEIVPLSFASGALLSLSVPILVPLLFRLG